MRADALMIALALAPALTVAALAGRSDAGIIVLDDGATIVGKFGPADVGPEEVVVRSLEGERGSTMKVERRRVRWLDPAAFAPTDAYFERHLEDPLERRWEPLRQAFIARRRGPDPTTTPTLDEDLAELLREPPLGEPLPTAARATLRVPRGWVNGVEDQVTMFVSRRGGPTGYPPRIHVFSAEAPRAGAADQLVWVTERLRALAADDRYEHEELFRLREVPGGADQVMVTRSRARDGRLVRALRKISFRGERTYFFAAYADARDFDQEFGRFWASLESFTPDEDLR
ncbi:MAG: hypothetical protein M9894_07180 [Planctomycetes bacterium]|nr:hypothetical protein [Planctomycetota bacterium]